MKTVTLLIALALFATGCAITADRYKLTPLMSGRGSTDRVVECKDGYWWARDRRGTIWCVNENYAGTAFDYETLPRSTPICNGTTEVVVVEKRYGGRSYCAAIDSIE